MSRRLPVLFRFFLLLLFVLGFSQWSSRAYSAQPALPVFCNETPRIMPLGDSITVGKSSGVPDTSPELMISYRKDLWDSLYADGYSVDFVGSQTNGEAYPGFDPNHEGHGGYTDSQIAQNIYNNGGANWLSSLGANWPHIILLHIGTNSLDTSPADVETILNEIDEYEMNTGHHITVILARIADRVPNNPDVHIFNDNVQAMAQARTGDDIVMVDMEVGATLIYQLQPTGDFFNSLHPYATGYTKMAAVWKTALDSIFANCNQQPQITNPGPQTNAEGDSPSLQISASDEDTGQTLTFFQSGLPPDLSIDPVTGLISGTISYEAASVSPYEVTVTVEDNGQPAKSNSTMFEWTVTNINRAPMATADSYSTNEDTSLYVDSPGILVNDSDPDGDPLTAHLVSGPSHGNLTLYGNGAFNYTPDDNYFGVDSFTYHAKDGSVESNDATVSINIAAVDDPTVANGQSVSTDEDTLVIITLTAVEVDGDGLTTEVVDPPTHGSLSGVSWPTLTYAPDANYNGTDKFTFMVNDGTSYSNIATVSLTINSVNDAPFITNPTNQENAEGDVVSLQIVADDIEKDRLSYSIAGQPPDLQIDPNTGIIDGMLNYGSAADSPYSVKVTVNDGQVSSEIIFAWTIQESPRLYLPLITAFR